MRAVGYRKSLPVDDTEALFDFETAKPEPRGRDIRVAVKAISANPVDYKVRKRAAPPAGETKNSRLRRRRHGRCRWAGCHPVPRPATRSSMPARDPAPGTNSEFHLVDERIVGRKPGAFRFAQAAALPLTSITAWELLFDRLGVRARQKRRSAAPC